MSGVRQKLLVAVSFAQNRWLHRLHTRAAVERFQARHVKKHGAFLRQHSPYFRDRPLIRSVEDLEQYPLMDKAMMMAEFNALNTRNLDRDTALDIAIQSEKTRDFQPMYNGVSVGLSSGTSGHRGLLLSVTRNATPGPVPCWPAFCLMAGCADIASPFSCGRTTTCMRR